MRGRRRGSAADRRRFEGAGENACSHRRQRRVDALNRLFDLFDGHDAAAEIARLKDQDAGF